MTYPLYQVRVRIFQRAEWIPARKQRLELVDDIAQNEVVVDVRRTGHLPSLEDFRKLGGNCLTRRIPVQHVRWNEELVIQDHGLHQMSQASVEGAPARRLVEIAIRAL